MKGHIQNAEIENDDMLMHKRLQISQIREEEVQFKCSHSSLGTSEGCSCGTAQEPNSGLHYIIGIFTLLFADEEQIGKHRTTDSLHCVPRLLHKRR